VNKNVSGAALALAVLTMAACGDGIGDVTSSNPSGSPTPVPTATPRPGTTPTPTPVPTPTPITGALTCNLPSLPHCDDQCCTAGGSVVFRVEIEAAEADLYKTQPGLFLSNGDVKDKLEYIAALSKRLTQMTGICSEPNGHDEIRTKNSQTTSQHIDVLIADQTPWVGGAYTCRPASF
jgi:hypothetical protein